MNAVVDRWDTIFKAVVTAGGTERIVVIFNEFQYFGRTNPAFPFVFQRI